MAHGGADLSTEEPACNTCITIMVIGKTGTGKSTTCNTILKKKEFEEGKGARSKTESARCVEMSARGRMLYVIDTPGTMDVKDPKKALQELLQAIDHCPDGIDAFLLTFRCDVRATEEEIAAAEQALDTFGPESYKRAIVVFTHGKVYENDVQEYTQELVSIRREIPRLGDLLSKLGNRWVLLENDEKYHNEVQNEQVTTLISKVAALVKKNPRRYLKNDQEQAEIMRREREKELKRQCKKACREEMMMVLASLQLYPREYGIQMKTIELQVKELERQLELEKSKGTSCVLQ